MRTAFALAALAGSAIAAPYKSVRVVIETVIAVETVYVTEGYEVAKPTPSAVYQAPAVTTVVYETPAASSSVHVAPVKPSSKYVAPVVPSSTYEAPVYVAPTPTPEEVKPTPTPTPEEVKPTPTPTPVASSGYMATVNTWRAKLNMKALIQDALLESNAMDTVVASNGEMVHKLNPGSFAQVLAPTEDTDAGFLSAFVGGWLCERSNLEGLQGVCAQMSKGWSYEGQTGHADILTSDKYSKIGCKNHAGILCCDLA